MSSHDLDGENKQVQNLCVKKLSQKRYVCLGLSDPLETTLAFYYDLEIDKLEEFTLDSD